MEEVKQQSEDDISNILQKFGKYQIVQYIYICLPTFFIAMNNVNYVFVAGDIKYRCRVPECEATDSSFSPTWWPGPKPEDMDFNRCYKPVLNETYLIKEHCNYKSFISSVVECTDWVYASNDTVVAWLNLACNSWKANFIGTIHSIGTVFGMLIGGWATDRFGRKPTIIIAAVTVVGNLKTWISSYYGYILMEFVESVIAGIAFGAGMVLIIEISGNNKRVLSGVLYAYAIYLGEAMLACIAVAVPYWKWLLYIICTPSILCIFYIKLLEESPRWLVLNNKLDEARRVLKLIAKMNNINIKDIDNAAEDKLRQACNIEVAYKKEGYREAFKSIEMVKRLLVATVCRFTVTFIYYGLVANSVWLPGNKYTNYILTSLMSFPGDLLALYFMNKWGRKRPLIYGYLICGAACVSSAYIPSTCTWLKILLFMIGKLLVSACYTGIWTYTMELFPTSVRGSMFGLCTFTASAGSMLGPLTPAMDAISPALASILFGISAVTSSVLILLTPETKDQPLPGTIEDVKEKERTNNNRKLGVDNDAFDNDVVTIRMKRYSTRVVN